MLANTVMNRACRFVVTTRPQSYTGASRLAGFHEVRIDDLQPEAIEGFLGHWSRALFPGERLVSLDGDRGSGAKDPSSDSAG